MLNLLLLSLLILADNLSAADAAPANKKKILLVVNKDVVYPAGGHDYRVFNEITMSALTKLGDFDVTISTKRDDPTLVDNLAQYSIVMFYGAGGRFTDPKAEQLLLDFVSNGGAVVGVHATDAYHDSKAYFQLIGAHFDGHAGGTWWVRVTDHTGPITGGMHDFQTQDEAYKQLWIPGYVPHNLLSADCGTNHDSIAWTSQYGKGRVFNTTLGHDKFGYSNPGFLRLVVRGIYWSAGLPPKDPDLTTAKEELP